jgi:uncharacterized delta-60 repeat protein
MKKTLFFFVLVITALRISAQAGNPDFSFGYQGVVKTPVGNNVDIGNAVAIQTDGKIVVAGECYDLNFNPDFSLVRYLTNGILDTTFGIKGKVIADFGGNGFGMPRSIIILKDGKILVAGTGVLRDLRMLQFKTNGTLDSSFGNNGKVVTTIPATSIWVTTANLQRDEKIVVAATTGIDTSYYFSLLRYNKNGVIDSSFGSGGIISTLMATSYEGCTGSAIQQDGKIVISGTSHPHGTDLEFSSARFLTTGVIDSTYGGAGKVYTKFNGFASIAKAVAFQHNGKIVIAGEAENDFALVRYNNDGSLDSTFGVYGVMRKNFFGQSLDRVKAMVIQSDDKIVLGGYMEGIVGSQFVIIRFNANGIYDNTFQGSLVPPSNNGTDKGWSLAIQNDGKIIMAGETSVQNGYPDFALIRFKACTTSKDTTWVSGCKNYNWRNKIFSKSGTYTDTTKNASGCDSIFVLKLSLGDVDTFLVVHPTELESYSITGNFQWIDCITQQPIPGATSNRFAPVKSGSYALVLTQNNCTDTTRCHYIEIGGSYAGKKAGVLFKVFPNPSDGIINIDLDGFYESVILTIKDLSGAVIHSDLYKETNKIRMPFNAAPGMYFIELTADDGNSSVIKLRKE